MKKEYTLHEEMLKVMTEEQILVGKIKWDLLEEAINNNKNPIIKVKLIKSDEITENSVDLFPAITWNSLESPVITLMSMELCVTT